MPTMASIREQFVIGAKGKKTGVILTLRRYQKLMQDLHDLAIVAERGSEEPISLGEMQRWLREDSNLQSRSKAICRKGPPSTVKING